MAIDPRASRTRSARPRFATAGSPRRVYSASLLAVLAKDPLVLMRTLLAAALCNRRADFLRRGLVANFAFEREKLRLRRRVAGTSVFERLRRRAARQELSARARLDPRLEAWQCKS